LDDSQLSVLLVQKKLISDGQLKAALDYQKSVGGRILDVLCKLDLVRPSQLEELFRGSESGAGAGSGHAADPDEKLNPASVHLGDLKVHHRLLAKVPHDLAEEHLIALFFPVNNVCSRRLIVGHGREIPAEVLAKIRTLLGVEVSTLALSEEAARGFRREFEARHGNKKPLKPEKQPITGVREAESPTDDKLLLKALVGLLVKKSVLSEEELQVEKELLRQLHRERPVGVP
jgi:hypothetical protein